MPAKLRPVPSAEFAGNAEIQSEQHFRSFRNFRLRVDICKSAPPGCRQGRQAMGKRSNFVRPTADTRAVEELPLIG
jgi:hypothetical protein